jgi:hypothetical protein
MINKMQNWQVEIKRLDKIRLQLGLNYNQLEKITQIDRGQLKRFFEFKNVSSMKFYFDVKVALEQEFEVKFLEIIPKTKVLIAKCDCKIENGLLKRGKIKCTLSKAEHKV